MPNDKNEFFDLLRNIDNKTRRIPTSDQEILQQFVRQLESFSLVDADTELEQRDKTYFAVPENKLVNPGFTDDLTSWVHGFESDTFHTHVRDTTVSKTLFGSLASFKIDMTGSTGAGKGGRSQTITAAASEVWSFEAEVNVTALNSACKAVMKIEWLNGGGGVISSQTVEVTAVTSGFTLQQMENQTAPSTTANVRVSLFLESIALGAVGTVYFDLIRAEQGESAVSDRASRIIVGEFVVT